MKNVIKVVSIVFGLMLVSGVVKSSPPPEPCKANDKLLEIMGDMLRQSKVEADMARREMIDTRKKYESLIIELEKRPCKK